MDNYSCSAHLVLYNLFYTGTQETTPSLQSSNILSPVQGERQVQTCFEKDGYAMNIVGGGTHSTSNNVNLVELKCGNKFHLNVSNMNEIGRWLKSLIKNIQRCTVQIIL